MNKTINWIVTGLTAVIGVVAAVVILGLATKGLASYLQNMNDTIRTASAIIGVALLTYAVVTFAVRVSKLAK